MTQESATPSYSAAEVSAIEAFHDAAVDQVGWHRDRGEGVERKAANLLGLVGLALVLVPFAVVNPAGIEGVAKVFLGWATGLAALFLAVAAICCVFVLRPRKSFAPESGQLQEEWASFQYGDGSQVAADVKGMLTNSLLMGADGNSSVLESIQQLADKKAKLLAWAAAATGFAVGALVVAVLAALVGG